MGRDHACVFVTIAAGGLLGGCINAPALPDESRIGLKDIVDRVRCELQAVTTRYKSDDMLEKRLDDYQKPAEVEIGKQITNGKRLPYERTDPNVLRKEERKLYDKAEVNKKYLLGNFIDKTAVAYVLTLKVKDTDGINNNVASAAWGGIPIPLGLFSFKVTGGINGTAQRIGVYKFSVYMREVRKWQDGNRCAVLPSRDADVHLNGHFGIEDWFVRTIDTADTTNTLDHFQSTATTLEFTLTPTVGIAPTWSIIKPNGHKFDGTFTLGAQRDYDNILDVALSPLADAGPSGPTPVLVTNFPPGGGGAEISEIGAKPVKKAPGRPLIGRVDPATQQLLNGTLLELQQNRLFRPLQ